MKDHDKIVHEFKEMPYERQIAIIYARNFYFKIEEYPFYRFETNKELMRGMILKYKIEDIDVYNCLIEQLFTHYSQYIEILPLDNKYFREFHDEIQELYVEVLHYRKKSIPLVSELKSKKESTTARAFFYFCLKEKGLFKIEETNRKSYLKKIGVTHGHGKDGESFYKIFNNLNIKTLENNTLTETIEMLENYFKENENLKKNEVIEYVKSHIK